MRNSFSSEWKRIQALSEIADKYGHAGKNSLAFYRYHNVQVRLSALLRDELDRHQRDIVLEYVEKTRSRIEYFSRKRAENSKPTLGQSPTTVALFGLSANPPTGKGGHLGIVDWCANSLFVDAPNDSDPEQAFESLPVDQVWVLPVYKHAFSEKSTLLSFEHRVAMAKLCFEDSSHNRAQVRVLELEKELFLRSRDWRTQDGNQSTSTRLGSIDLIRMLQSDFPKYQFVFVMGGDTYRDFRQGKWKGGFSLQELLPIVVCARQGIEFEPDPLMNLLHLQDVSSTLVRNSIDIEFLNKCLEPKVLDYIRQHQLYAFESS